MSKSQVIDANPAQSEIGGVIIPGGMTEHPQIGRWLVTAAAVTTAASLAIGLVFLTRYPPVFIDEPWFAEVAWNWLTAGGNFSPMHVETWGTTPWGYLSTLPWLSSFASFGLGLFHMRLPSWIFGTLLVVATAWAGWRSYGPLTGALAALLLSLNATFVFSSHIGRPDIVLATAVVIVYALACLALERGIWWAHVLAGALLTLSIDIHINALMFVPGLAVMYVIAYRRALLRRSGTWLCLIGAALGLTYFAAILITEGRTPFSRADVSVLAAFSHKHPLAFLSIRALLDSLISEYRKLGLSGSGLDFAVFAGGLAYLVVRRRREDLLLLGFFGTGFLAFVLFVGNKVDYYAVLLAPFVALVSAETLTNLPREIVPSRKAKTVRAFASILLALLIINGARDALLPMVRAQAYDYYAVTERIENSISEGSRVMGVPTWWLGLNRHEYTSALNLPYLRILKGYTLAQSLAVLRPDVLVLDDTFRGAFVDNASTNSGARARWVDLSGQEFEDFLAQKGQKVDEFTDPWHGRFEIYRIRWE